MKKVKEYVYDKLYGDKGEDAGKEGRGSDIDILCMDQVSSSLKPPRFHSIPLVQGFGSNVGLENHQAFKMEEWWRHEIVLQFEERG